MKFIIKKPKPPSPMGEQVPDKQKPKNAKYNCRIIVPDKALFNETLNVSLSWELEEADIENIPFLKIKIKKINALPK